MDPDPLSNPTILWELFFVVILLVLSSFFSASETAMMSVSRKKLLDALDTDSYDLEKNLKVSNRYLTLILVMNNIVNVLLSSLSTLLAIQLFPKGTSDSKLIATVTVVVTVLIVVFGEITPKLYARGNAPRFFKHSFPVIKVLDFIFRPVTWAFTAFSAFLINLFVGKPDVEPFISQDEILFNIDVGKKQGIIEEQESVLVKGALTLKDTYVREIMVPRVEIVAIESDKTLAEAVKVFDKSKFSRLPVYEKNIDEIIGICYAKDVLSILNSDGNLNETKVSDIMRNPYFVPETKKIDDLLQEMRKMKMHIAIVVDEYGGTAGIVTLEDVLEEMTGEIFDEFDVVEDETSIIKKDKYTYIVSGLAPLNDIERELDIRFPENEFETIGGYLLKVFERVPRPGEIVDTEDFSVKILESNKKQILKIEIKLKRKE